MCKALEELYADGKSEGKSEGIREGNREGEARFALLTEKLITASRTDDLLRAAKDSEFRGKLYQEYEINP